MRKHRLEELVDSVKERYSSDEFVVYVVNILDEQIRRQRKELRNCNEALGKAYKELQIATNERDSIRREFGEYNRDWYNLNKKCEYLQCDLEDEKAYRSADKVVIDALLEENEKLKKELEGKTEKGTLIELPCNVGDKVYFIVHGCDGFMPTADFKIIFKQIVSVEEYTCMGFSIDENYRISIVNEGCHEEPFGVRAFLTREEAEKGKDEYLKALEKEYRRCR